MDNKSATPVVKHVVYSSDTKADIEHYLENGYVCEVVCNSIEDCQSLLSLTELTEDQINKLTKTEGFQSSENKETIGTVDPSGVVLAAAAIVGGAVAGHAVSDKKSKAKGTAVGALIGMVAAVFLVNIYNKRDVTVVMGLDNITVKFTN